MRYEDTSGIGSPESSHEPIARADVDILSPGTYGPATGNAISGAGTNSGASGADTPGSAPAMIVAVHGAGGETTGGSGGFQALGQYGALSIDAQGNFNYVRNAGTPDGVKDVFQYTLADSAGATSSTTLTIDIAQVAAAAAGQAVVALPAGVEMSDIHVNGRDLVIDMPDGTQMVIPNGAVFVPQLAIGDVEVPSANLAALLIDSEPQPAAGPPQSSGGNFADPVPLLDPGAPLGDLIPPTELTYSPPDFHEVNQFENTKPTVIIETPDNPAGAVNAVDSVDESGLPARTIDGASEPEGTLAPQDIETTTGTIAFTAEDGLDNVTVNNVVIASVGQQIAGAHGILTITSIDLGSGAIGYTYTATDNTTDGVDDFENFTVVVTDKDGDTATGSLHISIADDEPIARNDTDSTDLVTHVATGNVMTGADTTSGAPGADTVGADDATLTAVSSNNTGAANSSFDGSGNLVVEGEFGSLIIKADGSYVYTAHQDAPGGSSEVFTYTLTDGDGDPAQATLTLTNPDHMPGTGDNAVVQLDDDALAGGNAGGVGDDADSAHTTGTLSGSGGDGALSFVLTEDGAPDGFTYSLQANGNLWVMQGSTHVLTITVDSATGAYAVTQVAAIDHAVGDNENNVEFNLSYTVTDSDGDPATGHLTVNVDDDTPIARNDADVLDSNGHAAGNVVTGVGTNAGSGSADSYGADGPGQLIGVSSNGTGQADSSFDGSGNLIVHGSFGTLMIDAHGEYTYARDANSTEAGSEVFTYTIVDGDGDTTTATLTFAIPNINHPVEITNLTPLVDGGDAIVYEDDLSDGSDTSKESTTVPGAFNISAPDGVDDLTVGTIQVFINGVFQAGASGSTPLGNTLTFTGYNSTTGEVSYTYTLLDNETHPNDAGNNSIFESFNVTLTDTNGDSDTDSLVVQIVDDVPDASVSGQGVPGITLDESATGTDTSDGGLPNGIASDTVDFSGAFNAPVIGADGPGTVGYAIDLTGENVGSGLYALDPTDTDPDGGLGKGEEIILVDNGDGTVSGKIGSVEYFKISVDSDGKVTFEQEHNIWHPVTDNNDDAQSIVPDGGTLSLVQTVEDSDHDVDSASVDLSGKFTIQDDGPTSVADGEPTLPQLVVDESPLSGDGDNSDHANFAGAFADTADYGTDGPGAVHYALQLGTEGAGSGLYALDPSDTDPTGGLGKGDEIQLFTDGDTIVGKVGDTVYFTISVDDTGEVTLDRSVGENLWHSDAANPDDQDVLSAASGTIDLQQTIVDADGDHSSSTVDLSSGVFVFEDDGPTAVADTNTVTEGDTLTVVAADGVLSNDNFGTDGPGTIVGVRAADGDTTTPASGNVGTEIDTDYGKLTLYADGHYNYVSTDGAVPPAGAHDVFVYTIVDADGDTSTVTLDITLDNNNLIPVAGEASAAVDDEGLDGGIAGVLANGDIDANTGESGAGAGDESIFTGQLQGSGGDVPTSFLFEASLDGTTAAVGDETVTYQVSGDGQTLTATISDAGDRFGLTLFTVHIDDAAGDYTLTLVNPVMHSFGDGTEASAFLDIPYQMTDLDSDLSALPGTLHVEFNDDMPTMDATLSENATVTLDESGPGAAATIDLGIYAGNAVHDEDVSGSGPIAVGNTSGAAVVDVNELFGADGAGSLTYALTITGTSGLQTTEGEDINLVQLNDGTIVGIVETGGEHAGDVAFAVQIDQADGDVTVEQYLSLQHPDNPDPNDDVQLANGAIGVVATVTDADGDSVTNDGAGSNPDPVDISGQITFLDDGPTNLSADNNQDFGVTLDESGPVPASAHIAINDVSSSTYTAGDDLHVTGAGPIAAGASLVGAVDASADFGADGPMGDTGLTYALDILSEGGTTNLTTTEGVAIDLVQLDNGNVLGIVHNTTTVAFAVAIDSDSGDVSVEQYLSLFHGDPTMPDEAVTLDGGILGVTATATDGDGDYITGTPVDIGTSISFHDDAPSQGDPSGTPPTITLDESPPPTAGDGDSSNSAAFAGLFASSSAGADGPHGDAQYTLVVTPAEDGGSVGSGLYALDATDTDPGVGLGSDGDGYGQGDEILLVQVGDHIEGQVNSTTYFTIAVDPGTGEVTFSQQENIWHSDTSNNDDSETLTASGGTLAIVQTITDGDLDTSSASVDLSSNVFVIQDDGPSTFVPDTAVLDNDTGSVTGVSLDTGDGDLSENFGTDGPGTVRFGVTEGGNSGLTSNGAAILYHLSADGLTLNGYVDDGQHTGFQSGEDDTIFTITLDPGNSTYDVTMDGHVDAHSNIDFNDGSYDFVGGNDPWAGFVPVGQIDHKSGNTPVDDDSHDLLLTPFSDTTKGDSINGNANSAGVGGGGGGQNIGSDEGIRLDFVTDLTGNPAGSPSNYDGVLGQQDHVFDGHYNVNDVSVKFGDGASDTTIRIEAYDNVDNPNDYVLGQGDEVNITKIFISYDGEKQEYDFDPLHPTTPQTLTVGNGNNLDGHADRSYTVTWVDDGSGVYHVEVTGILDTNVRIATHGETDYQALEIEYKSGDDFAVTGFGAVAETQDPVTFHIPVDIVDADGDTVAGDPLNITVNPVVSNNLAPLSLLSSNDNGTQKQAGTNSMVLSAALAAAGLSSTDSAAAHGSDGSSGKHDHNVADTLTSGHSTPQVADRHETHDRVDHALDQAAGGQHEAIVSRTPVTEQHVQTHLASEHHQDRGPGELLQATAGPAHGGGTHGAHFAAQGISMPSAEQMASLAAPDGGAKAPDVAQQGQHDQVVGKVLADALHGGGHGHNIDHLLDAASGSHGGHGHANAALEALASQSGGAVPFGHMSFAASFHGGAMLPMMDALAVHQDAAPTHG